MAATLNLVEVTRDNHSGLYSLKLPTLDEVGKVWRSLGVKSAVPDRGDKFWDDFQVELARILPGRHAIAAELSNFGKENTAMTVTRVSHDHPGMVLNRRHVAIREMSGTQAIAECRTLGIPVVEHPTNPGITAMRAKNALYARARHVRPPTIADAA